jgi:hypothetical protein
VINLKKQPVEIELEGFINPVKIISTTENILWNEGSVPEKGITLGAESVNTLIF